MENSRLLQDFRELFSDDNKWMSNFDDSTILVTGGTGLIGSVLCRAILYYNNNFDCNIHLICHVINIEKAKSIYSDYLPCSSLSFVVGDINEGITFDGEVDYIIQNLLEILEEY